MPESPNFQVIITRQQEDAVKTAAILAKHSVETFIEPVFTTKIISRNVTELLKLAANYDAIIITSKNAIKAISRANNFITDTKFIILGKASYAAAKKCGFVNLELAGNNFIELCQYIKSKYNNKNFLYASGKTISAELTTGNCNNNVTRVIIYKTIPRQKFSQQFKQLLINNKFTAITFFSKKTASSWYKILQNEGLEKYNKNLTAFCLSNSIALHIKTYGFKATMAAKNPNMGSIIKLIAKYSFH